MANFVYTLGWQDADGHQSTMKGFLVAADLAAATAALEAIAEAADVLTGAKLVSANITSDVSISAWTTKASATASSDVEIGGRFIFRTLGGFLSKITIPGFLKDTLTAAGGLIDTTADVLTFISAVATGGGSTSHYEDLSSYTTGYETFNGKR